MEPEPEKEKREEEEELKSVEEKKEEENREMAEAPKKKTRRKKKKKTPAGEGGAAASMWADAPPPRHITFGMPAGAESPLHSDDLMCPPDCACDWCSGVDAPDDFSIEKWDEERRDRKYL